VADRGETWEREPLGRGLYRHTQYMRPEFYEDIGGLRRIEPGWGDSGIPDFPHVVRASRLVVSVGDGGMRRIHPTREADRYMEIGGPYVKVGGEWTRVPFASATRSGSSLTWHRKQADLRITHTGHGIKLDLELLGGYVPEGGLIAFPVGLRGLTLSAQGAALLADGRPVARLRAPVVVDAGDPMDGRPIGWKFASVGGQVYVVLTLPDLAGMSRPVVDPTLTLQPSGAVGQDTFLASNYVTNNYGIHTSCVYSTALSKGLMRWDLSSIPAGTVVNSAVLTLRVNTAILADRTLTFYPVSAANGDWTEGAVSHVQAQAGEPCWNAKCADGSGGVTTAWAGAAGMATAGVDYVDAVMGSAAWLASMSAGQTLDVSLDTRVVATWLGAVTNDGMMAVVLPTIGGIALLDSSDSGTSSARPKLVVVYGMVLGGGRFHGYRR